FPSVDTSCSATYILSLRGAVPSFAFGQHVLADAVAVRESPVRRPRVRQQIVGPVEVHHRVRAADPLVVDADVGVKSASDRRTTLDRKSTRLNSSHAKRSYADFCLK